jgi:hypothetical protein
MDSPRTLAKRLRAASTLKVQVLAEAWEHLQPIS